MDKKNIKTDTIQTDSEALQKKEIRLFTIVMVVFTIGMALLLFYDVSAWWFWYIYFVVWTLVELKIARNIKFKWWFWVLIIVAILSIDILVLELIDYIKK